jgi:rod shape-determining protein MreC
METSRDDFIIAIRSAFIQKGTQQRFSLIALIFFALLFIILSSYNFKTINYVKIAIKEVIYRSSFVVSIPENYLKKSFVKIKDHFKLYNEYKDIKLELETLKADKTIDNFIVSENKRLKLIVNDYFLESEETVARILIDKQSPFLRSVIINKGSKNNIKKGFAVLDKKYLVGKVVEVNYLTSRILLLSDLNSKIPVSIEPKGLQAILSGTGEESGIIQYQKKDFIIEEGSQIYTSGSGNLFKAGIPIGKIINTNKEDEKKVIFYSDFSQLNFVKIMSFEREEK